MRLPTDNIKEYKKKYNFRQIAEMPQGEDNCFICAGQNEEEIDNASKQKMCRRTKICPGAGDEDYICDKYKKSKLFNSSVFKMALAMWEKNEESQTYVIGR